MNLLGLATRNLRRRPLRTVLSILGIGLAVGSALALVALSRSIETASRESMDEMGDDFMVTQKGASDLFGGFLPENIDEAVAKIPGVVRVSGELFMFAPSEKNRQVLTLGWPDNSYLWKNVPIREGRVPHAGERHVAMLGDTAADVLGKKVGDSVELLGDKFEVIGIAKYATLVNRGLVIVPLIDLQEASYRQKQVTMIHVNVTRGASAAEIARIRGEIEALGRVTVSTSSESLKTDRNFQILDAISIAISIIAVAMGALNVLNALLMATQERTREIGIVAAIGWSDTRIMSSIVLEGLVMCIFGCALGIALSFLAALAFPLIPAIGNILSFRPSVAVIAPTVGAAFALCLIGSLYPAWRAVRLNPAEALKHV